MCLVLRTSFFTMNGCRKKRLDPLWKELKKYGKATVWKVLYFNKKLNTFETPFYNKIVKPGPLISDRKIENFNKLTPIEKISRSVYKGIHVYTTRKFAEWNVELDAAEILKTDDALVVVPAIAYKKDLVAMGMEYEGGQMAVFYQISISEKDLNDAKLKFLTKNE